MPPAGDPEFCVGGAVRVARRITFKSGKVIETGSLGVVTKVPGVHEGSPAQVRVEGSLFSVEVGDVEPALGESDLLTAQLQQKHHGGSLAAALCPGTPTERSQSGSAGAELPPVEFGTAATDAERLVPVRHVQYADALGRWGDTLQKARVSRLQRQLEAAAGRLTEEAAAKFEEVAWLQQELERWHLEAEGLRQALERLQHSAQAKEEAVERAQQALAARDADVAWLREELQRKNAEANAANGEVARLDNQVRQKIEELTRLELVLRKKNNEESERYRDMEHQIDELRSAHTDMEEQLYAKMEELARIEGALKAAEDKLRAQDAAAEGERLRWTEQETELKANLSLLEAKLAQAREEARGGVTLADAHCQADTDLAELYARAEAKVVELRARVAASQQEVARLEGQLDDALAQRGERIEGLMADIAARDARIAELEAQRGASWRQHAAEPGAQQRAATQDRRVEQLEQELSRLRAELRERSERLGNAAEAERGAAAMLDDADSRERRMAARLREAERNLRSSERRQWELERLRDALDAKVVAATGALRDLQDVRSKLEREVDEARAIAAKEKAAADEMRELLAQLRSALPVVHRARLQQELQELVAPLLAALRAAPDAPGGLAAPRSAPAAPSLGAAPLGDPRVSPPRHRLPDQAWRSWSAAAPPPDPLVSTASSAAWAGRRALAAAWQSPAPDSGASR